MSGFVQTSQNFSGVCFTSAQPLLSLAPFLFASLRPISHNSSCQKTSTWNRGGGGGAMCDFTVERFLSHCYLQAPFDLVFRFLWSCTAQPLRRLRTRRTAHTRNFWAVEDGCRLPTRISDVLLPLASWFHVLAIHDLRSFGNCFPEFEFDCRPGMICLGCLRIAMWSSEKCGKPMSTNSRRNFTFTFQNF